jgi:hypothetical protein
MTTHNELIVMVCKELAKGCSVEKAVQLVTKHSQLHTEKDFLRAIIVVEVALASSFRPPISRENIRTMMNVSNDLQIKVPIEVNDVVESRIPKVTEVVEVVKVIKKWGCCWK